MIGKQCSDFFKTYNHLLPTLVFCGFILMARIVYTGKITFVFLLWNLFLAFLPFVFSYRLNLNRPTKLNFIKALLCLLFLPNAPYILTDLFHIKSGLSIMLWYDTLLIAAFAWCGMLFFFYSLKNIEHFLSPLCSQRFLQVLTLSLCFSSGFGIYIGRFLRFNSWDVFQQPFVLIANIFSIVFNPMQHPRALGVTILYGLFLFVVYQQFKPKAIALSLRRED